MAAHITPSFIEGQGFILAGVNDAGEEFTVTLDGPAVAAFERAVPAAFAAFRAWEQPFLPNLAPTEGEEPELLGFVGHFDE